MKTFYAVLANSLVAFLANTFVWFAATFWAYLETKSVVATSIMAGVYTVTVAFSGFFLGSLVDRYNKKTAMLLSSVLSLALYLVALGIYATSSAGFTDAANPLLWVFIVLILFGAILDTRVAHADAHAHRIDIRGTVAAIGQVSGLFGLIFFNTFNNFLGGVFMSLMDPYGLELVSVQVWGACSASRRASSRPRRRSRRL